MNAFDLPSGIRLLSGCSVFVLCAAAAPARGLAAPAAPDASSVASAAPASAAVGRAEAVFEPNVGQSGTGAAFLARGGDFTLALSATSATLIPHPAARSSAPPRWQRGGAPSARRAGQAPAAEPVRVTWLGADPDARLAGEGTLGGTVNYFRGPDPSHWLTDVPTFARVRYTGLYPGIDLVYKSAAGGLEYDFELAPGADPSAIRIAVEGARRVEIEPNGDLRVETEAGSFVERAPVCYQDAGGERRAVAGRFAVSAAGVVGFELGAYDAARPVVIDPVVAYSTYLGGSGTEIGYSIAVDREGCVYVAGSTNSLDFPVEGPIDTRADDWRNDVFVTKLSADGSSLVYSTYLSGSTVDDAAAVAVDPDGCVYLTGNTGSADFPTLAGLHDFAGVRDAFVTKISKGGSALEFSSFLGGSDMEFGNAVAVDRLGTLWVAGTTGSPDFPVVGAVTQGAGSTDAFVAAFSKGGGGLALSTLLGGSAFDAAYALAPDNDGGAVVVGMTESPDFPTRGGVQRALEGESDAYVARVSTSGLVFSTYYGGRDTECANGVAVDASGEIFFGGETRSPDLPVAGGGLREPAPTRPDADGYLAALDAAGRAVDFATYLGGTLSDGVYALALAPNGDPVVTGYTDSRNFPVHQAVQGDPGDQRSDAFVYQVSRAGFGVRFATYLGGDLDDRGWGVAAGDGGVLYVTGLTLSTNYPTTDGAFQRQRRGINEEAFVTKLALGA